jgi:hypothetical protein
MDATGDLMAVGVANTVGRGAVVRKGDTAGVAEQAPTMMVNAATALRRTGADERVSIAVPPHLAAAGAA